MKLDDIIQHCETRELNSMENARLYVNALQARAAIDLAEFIKRLSDNLEEAVNLAKQENNTNA